MTSELGRYGQNDTRLVHHLFVGINGDAAATTLELGTDGLVVASFSINPNFPRAAKLVAIAVNCFVGADNVVGSWTLRVRKNEGATDEATFVFGAVGGAFTKTAGPPSVECLFQAGDSYHVQADGPSKNQVYARVTLEWEVL